MSVKVVSKLPDVGTSIFAVMSGLANEYGAINLSQGFPDFEIDPKLKKLVVDAMDQNQVQYAPMAGRIDLREAIARKVKSSYGCSINPLDEITITAGGTQAIYCALAAVVNQGDQVIMFDPSYDCYDPAVRMHGGVPVHINLEYPDYRIDWEKLRSALTHKTRLIMFNNPQNPTGSIWTDNDMAQLNKIAEDFPNLLFLSDEVYEHIHFGDRHLSVLENDTIRGRCFTVFSFGKTFHVTGWKVGYCIAPVKLTNELRSNFQFNVFCVNNTMQYALSQYMQLGDTWSQIPSFYFQKLSLFQEGMMRSRFKPMTCRGSYFCLYNYADISDEPDLNFAKRLTKEFGVACIPLSVFYKDKSDHKILRFCFAKKDETLNAAIDKLCMI